MSCEPKIWGDTLCRLQKAIPDFAYATWIAPLVVKTSSERIVLGCPSSFHRDRVRIQYRDLLERSLATDSRRSTIRRARSRSLPKS